MTLEQQALVEQLYENESLTDNLTDDDAKALLRWAQEQIGAAADGALVKDAVSAANQSGAAGAQNLLTQAKSFLAKAMEARGAQAAPADPGAPGTMMNPDAKTAHPPTAAAIEKSARHDALGNGSPLAPPPAHAEPSLAPTAPPESFPKNARTTQHSKWKKGAKKAG